MQAQNQPRPAPGTMCPCGGNIRILHLFELSLLAIPTCCTHKYPLATGPFPSALPTPVWSNLTTFVSNRHTPRPAVPLAAPWLLVANEVLVMRDGLMDHLRVEPVSKEPGRFNGTMVSSR